MADYVGFSYHFDVQQRADEALTSIQELLFSKPAHVVLGRGVYVKWNKKVRADAGRVWYNRHLKDSVGEYAVLVCHRVQPVFQDDFMPRRVRLIGNSMRHEAYQLTVAVPIDAGVVAPHLVDGNVGVSAPGSSQPAACTAIDAPSLHSGVQASVSVEHVTLVVLILSVGVESVFSETIVPDIGVRGSWLVLFATPPRRRSGRERPEACRRRSYR